ncbi:MAG TPA: alpha/beta hydrolase [Candidatus Acidoferrales bacterium]|nr:alpha/beta hydrolase [Candidatus Acidoferrales bacterium]
MRHCNQPLLALPCIFLLNFCAAASTPPGTKSGFITTSDGVKIHYLEAGREHIALKRVVGQRPMDERMPSLQPQRMTSILFVPGWSMPAWIWEKQIAFFSHNYRVVAMDPRCQGDSSQTSDGLYPAAMARDIKAVVEQLHLAPVVLVGWSMAVKEVLSYVDQFGTKDVAGLVLVDNNAGGFSQGEAEADFGILKGVLEDREKAVSFFVRNVQFKKSQPEEYVQRLMKAALRVPANTAVALIVGAYEADLRNVLPKIDKPTLVCAANSPYMGLVEDMQKHIPGSQLEIFEGAGHALFVDDPDHFNSVLENFLGGLAK